jgi:hypothetical protein
VVGTVGVPSSSAAPETATVSATEPIPEFDSGGLGITGTDGPDLVTLTFDPAAADYEIEVQAGVSALAPCRSVSRTIAKCPRLGPVVEARLEAGSDAFMDGPELGGAEMYVYGDSGSDSLSDQSVSSAIFNGGRGDDFIRGSEGLDSLFGGEGRDSLFGGGGRDRLEGGRGVDRLFGGGDFDRLVAADRKADKTIDCGDGSRDRTEIDRQLDPTPISCETIQRPPALRTERR